uniref:Uncharacterized protein n=1 Tax=Bionectria ochroleuca TaxID=29856 RepID=A0A8H7N5X2_BIOOC
MKGTHEEPEEEEEGEQAAAQMEGQAEHLPGESRPHCADDGILASIAQPKATTLTAVLLAAHSKWRNSPGQQSSPSQVQAEHQTSRNITHGKAQGARPRLPHFNHQLLPQRKAPARRLRLASFNGDPT